MVNPLYDLRDVTFEYPGRPRALDQINLRILPGEDLVLLGANGSGKSTLIGILAGLQSAASGDALFEGRALQMLEHDAAFRRNFRRRVGVLFQNSDTQLFCPSVLEEIAFGPLQYLPHEDALARTRQALAEYDLEALSDYPPYALSGGEKRRVALAAILVNQPDILLLDEPTANLDPRTCDFLLDVLSTHLHNGDKTVITATHDLAAARALASTCALMTPLHDIAAHANLDSILADEDLLLQVNLTSRRNHSAPSDHIRPLRKVP